MADAFGSATERSVGGEVSHHIRVGLDKTYATADPSPPFCFNQVMNERPDQSLRSRPILDRVAPIRSLMYGEVLLHDPVPLLGIATTPLWTSGHQIVGDHGGVDIPIRGVVATSPAK
ncbi:hypothetical protein AB0C15_01925 [Micromonospora sp. NPDC048835]|uniref:hypothetical protein n=1 Tax=Micromonospora sp. NPDC048835 TaxID=3155147 RepID=UPI0033E3AC0B